MLYFLKNSSAKVQKKREPSKRVYIFFDMVKKPL